ncbi:MAG: DUF2304 domain-containing protein [Clostridia bacterium]
MKVDIFFLIVGLLLAMYIINLVRKNKFDIKESIIWLFGSIGVIVLSVFPSIISYLSKLVGIEYPPSLFFLICTIFILLINFRISKKTFENQEKLITLIQEVSILEEEIKKINNKKSTILKSDKKLKEEN